MNQAFTGQLALILAAQDGCIAVRPLPFDSRKFTGNTVAETALLHSITGRSTFLVADYDDILAQVGEWGWGLQAPEDLGGQNDK